MSYTFHKKGLKKTISENISKCDFKEALRVIKSVNSSLSTQDAIDFIITCCTICNSNMSTLEKVPEEDLCHFLNYLLFFVIDPTPRQLEKYILAVFHILKLISSKGNTKVILQLEDVLVPSFLITTFNSEPAGRAYHSLCSLIRNVIICELNKSGNPSEIMKKLSYLVTRMYAEKVHQQEGLITVTHHIISTLIKVKIDGQDLYKFYCNSLNSLTNCVGNGEELSIFLMVFSLVYVELFRCKEFDLISVLCEEMLQKLPNLFKNDDNIEEISKVLSISKWIIPTSVADERILELSLASLKKVRGVTAETLQGVLNIILAQTSALIQFYKDYKDYKPKDDGSLLKFYELLTSIAKIYSLSPAECNCGCKVTKNLKKCLQTLDCLATLADFHIRAVKSSDQVKLALYNCFKLQFELLIRLREEKCKKFEQFWKRTGLILYNIGLKFCQDCDENQLKFMTLFVEMFYRLEGFINATVFDKKYFAILLDLIADHHYQAKNYVMALITQSCCLVLAEKKRDKYFSLWATYKLSLKSSKDIQALTIPKLIDKYRSEVEVYLPGFTLTRDEQVDLIIFELHSYKTQWSSKIPMWGACKHLSQLAQPEIQAGVFVDIWWKFGSNIHEEIPILLNQTLKKYEKSCISPSLTLARLYYISHEWQVKGKIINVCETIDKTLNTTKLSVEPNTDPNNECDIVSSYGCLKLDKYVKIIGNLNKSLEICEALMKTCDFSEPEQFYNLLTELGHEYRLRNHLIQYFQSWEFALKLAESVDKKLWVLESISFILEFADLSKDCVENLIEKGDLIAANLSFDENLHDLVGFYLSRATIYLKNCDVTEAYDTFLKVYAVRDDFKSNSILTVRFLQLHHKLVSLPCDYQIVEHNEQPLVKIHLAYRAAHPISSPLNNYGIALGFEVGEDLARFYDSLWMPRHVRSYVKEFLLTAQRMILPFRTMSFLYYLAIADLLTGKLDDCRVKISGFFDILNLSKSKPRLGTKSPIFQSNEQLNDDIVNNLNMEFKELMLDAPPVMNFRQSSPGSPVFHTENFKFPNSLCHSKKCDCFQCKSPEYHEFVLKNTFLQALLNVHEANTSNARNFFAGGVKLYKYYKDNQIIFKTRLENQISCHLIPDFHVLYFETYCKLLLEYGNGLLRSRAFSEADGVNQKLISYLKPKRLNHNHLYNEALLQKLNILRVSQLQGLKRMDTLNVEPCSSVANVKTPENKLSTAFLVPKLSPENIKACSRAIKKIQFELSDTEDDRNDAKLKPKSDFASIFDEAVTPAPHSSSSAKMRVYTGGSRSVRRKKMTETALPKFKLLPDDSAVSMTPEAPASKSSKASVKVEKGLNCRTKLLTDKLKTPRSNMPKICKVEPPEITITSDDDNFTQSTTVLRKSKRNRN